MITNIDKIKGYAKCGDGWHDLTGARKHMAELHARAMDEMILNEL